MDFTQGDESIRLIVRDEDGNHAEATVEVPFEPSRDPSQMRNRWKRTSPARATLPFGSTGLTIRPQAPVFFP